MADRQCPFAPVPAVSDNFEWLDYGSDWVRDTNIPTLSSVLEYYSLSALHSFVIYLPGIFPLLIALLWNSALSGLALANQHLVQGPGGRGRITYPAPSSSFRVALGIGLFWKKEAALLGTTQSLSSFPNEWLGSMLGSQLSSPHLGSILAPTLLTTGPHSFTGFTARFGK
jgi:hypothetical protein